MSEQTEQPTIELDADERAVVDQVHEAIDALSEAARFNTEEAKVTARGHLRGFVTTVVSIIGDYGRRLAELERTLSELEALATQPDATAKSAATRVAKKDD